MPLCNRMFCCIFGSYFFIEIKLKYENIIWMKYFTQSNTNTRQNQFLMYLLLCEPVVCIIISEYRFYNLDCSTWFYAMCKIIICIGITWAKNTISLILIHPNSSKADYLRFLSFMVYTKVHIDKNTSGDWQKCFISPTV